MKTKKTEKNEKGGVFGPYSPSVTRFADRKEKEDRLANRKGFPVVSAAIFENGLIIKLLSRSIQPFLYCFDISVSHAFIASI